MRANNNVLYKEYMTILNFPFINPDYIVEIYYKIKNKCKENNFF